jgi:hypothetical protein
MSRLVAWLGDLSPGQALQIVPNPSDPPRAAYVEVHAPTVPEGWTRIKVLSFPPPPDDGRLPAAAAARIVPVSFRSSLPAAKAALSAQTSPSSRASPREKPLRVRVCIEGSWLTARKTSKRQVSVKAVASSALEPPEALHEHSAASETTVSIVSRAVDGDASTVSAAGDVCLSMASANVLAMEHLVPVQPRQPEQAKKTPEDTDLSPETAVERTFALEATSGLVSTDVRQSRTPSSDASTPRHRDGSSGHALGAPSIASSNDTFALSAVTPSTFSRAGSFPRPGLTTIPDSFAAGTVTGAKVQVTLRNKGVFRQGVSGIPSKDGPHHKSTNSGSALSQDVLDWAQAPLSDQAASKRRFRELTTPVEDVSVSSCSSTDELLEDLERLGGRAALDFASLRDPDDSIVFRNVTPPLSQPHDYEELPLVPSDAELLPPGKQLPVQVRSLHSPRFRDMTANYSSSSGTEHLSSGPDDAPDRPTVVRTMLLACWASGYWSESPSQSFVAMCFLICRALSDANTDVALLGVDCAEELASVAFSATRESRLTRRLSPSIEDERASNGSSVPLGRLMSASTAEVTKTVVAAHVQDVPASLKWQHLSRVKGKLQQLLKREGPSTLGEACRAVVHSWPTKEVTKRRPAQLLAETHSFHGVSWNRKIEAHGPHSHSLGHILVGGVTPPEPKRVSSSTSSSTRNQDPVGIVARKQSIKKRLPRLVVQDASDAEPCGEDVSPTNEPLDSFGSDQKHRLPSMQLGLSNYPPEAATMVVLTDRPHNTATSPRVVQLMGSKSRSRSVCSSSERSNSVERRTHTVNPSPLASETSFADSRLKHIPGDHHSSLAGSASHSRHLSDVDINPTSGNTRPSSPLDDLTDASRREVLRSSSERVVSRDPSQQLSRVEFRSEELVHGIAMAASHRSRGSVVPLKVPVSVSPEPLSSSAGPTTEINAPPATSVASCCVVM